MITREYKFNNGDVVRERITGFTGTIVGSVTYITGCNQYLLTAKQKDQFSEAVSCWYDEGRLDLLPVKGVSVEEVAAKDNGCDTPAPKI